LASGNLVHGVVQGVEQRTMDSGFPTMLLHLDTVSDDATPVDSLVQVEVPGGYWIDPATGQEQWLDMGFPLFTPGESILVDASVSSEGVHRPHFGPFSVFRIQGGVLHDLSQNPVVSLPCDSVPVVARPMSEGGENPDESGDRIFSENPDQLGLSWPEALEALSSCATTEEGE
jgi:hypothetical protein